MVPLFVTEVDGIFPSLLFALLLFSFFKHKTLTFWWHQMCEACLFIASKFCVILRKFLAPLQRLFELYSCFIHYNLFNPSIKMWSVVQLFNPTSLVASPEVTACKQRHRQASLKKAALQRLNAEFPATTSPGSAFPRMQDLQNDWGRNSWGWPDFVSPLFHPHWGWKFTQKGKDLFAWCGDTPETVQQPKSSFTPGPIPSQPLTTRKWHYLVTEESWTKPFLPCAQFCGKLVLANVSDPRFRDWE